MNTYKQSSLPDQDFMHQYEHPYDTVDILIFTIDQGKLKIILIERGVSPFKGFWAIPGGFIRINESLEDAAKRELIEETGVKNVYMEQLYTFGDPKRDPRSRVITVSYLGLVPNASVKLKATTDARKADWLNTNKLPRLAFDHQEIIKYALKRLQNKVAYSNIAHALLPKKFRLSELQTAYEIILGKKLDKRNFRKKMVSSGLLKSTSV